MHFIYYLYTILFGKCNLTNLNTPVYAKKDTELLTCSMGMAAFISAALNILLPSVA